MCLNERGFQNGSTVSSIAASTEQADNKHYLNFEDGGFVLDDRPVVARRRGLMLRVGCFYVSAAAWDELKALMNGEAR